MLAYSLQVKPMLYKVYTGGSHPGYRAQGIPHSFLISPDQKIVWSGNTNGLSEGTIREHLGKRVEFFKTAFKGAPTSAISKAVSARYEAAYKIAWEEAKNTKNAAKKESAQKLVDFLEPVVKAKLTRADGFFENKEYVLAQNIYKLMSQDLKGTEYGKLASEKLKQYKDAKITKEINSILFYEKILKACMDEKMNKKKRQEMIQVIQHYAKKYEGLEGGKKLDELYQAMGAGE